MKKIFFSKTEHINVTSTQIKKQTITSASLPIQK